MQNVKRPDASREEAGRLVLSALVKRNNGTVAASDATTDEENRSGLSLVKLHRMHSSPSSATDRATLPLTI